MSLVQTRLQSSAWRARRRLDESARPPEAKISSHAITMIIQPIA